MQAKTGGYKSTSELMNIVQSPIHKVLLKVYWIHLKTTLMVIFPACKLELSHIRPAQCPQTRKFCLSLFIGTAYGSKGTAQCIDNYDTHNYECQLHSQDELNCSDSSWEHLNLQIGNSFSYGIFWKYARLIKVWKALVYSPYSLRAKKKALDRSRPYEVTDQSPRQQSQWHILHNFLTL